MIEYELLYYPNFQPDVVWLKKVLLLSDRVNRIVPADVTLHDPDELLRLQAAIPDCLSSIEPRGEDVALENNNFRRLKRAFELLAEANTTHNDRSITITISGDAISFEGNTFLHASKLSPMILDALRQNHLILDEDFNEAFGNSEFYVVNEPACDLILCGIAEQIARRTGLDAITDKEMPFALGALNGLDIQPRDSQNGSEGALLTSLAEALIPSEVAILNAYKYRELRDAYEPIRARFKELTAKISSVNRLNEISDANVLQNEVDHSAREFVHEYELFRRTRYADAFKDWVPFCVAGVLTAATVAVDPKYAVAVAGASFAFQSIDKVMQLRDVDQNRNKVFSMLTGLTNDIVEKSKILHLV
jgi:hypothetical protein